MLRPCVVCQELAADARCPEHQRARPRRTGPLKTAERGYGSRWQRLAQRARKLQPFCSWCHGTEDLTTDHLRWPARSLEDVQVLCRSCNCRKGALRSFKEPA